MLPKYLDEYRLQLRAKAIRSPKEESQLVELEDLARRGPTPSSANESIQHKRKETSAWGGDPSKCPVCGR